MSEHGAALQTYNQELVKCVEELKRKRCQLQEVINREESEKLSLEKNVKLLQEKLHIVIAKLNQHKSLQEAYDKTIGDTELGFKKILESSQTLLNLAQHEASKLNGATNNDRKLQFSTKDDI